MEQILLSFVVDLKQEFRGGSRNPTTLLCYYRVPTAVGVFFKYFSKQLFLDIVAQKREISLVFVVKDSSYICLITSA